MKYNICDIHAHVLPQIDDGANNLEMSLNMIRTAYEQGTRNIICTSHSWGNLKQYTEQLEKIQVQAEKEYIGIRLYAGCEILCNKKEISSIIEGLNSGRIPTINKTEYVLVEFKKEVDTSEIISCIKDIRRNRYIPIIAHAERYSKLVSDEMALEELQLIGCLFQINAYSLDDSNNMMHRQAARALLDKHLISFIGSDAHQTQHRSYKIESGIRYIQKKCSQEYARDICYLNAEKLLGVFKNVNYKGFFDDYLEMQEPEYWVKFYDTLSKLGFEMDNNKSFRASFRVPDHLKGIELSKWVLSRLEEAPLQIVGNTVYSHFRHLTHWTSCGFESIKDDYLFMNSLPILEKKLVEYGIERIPSRYTDGI